MKFSIKNLPRKTFSEGGDVEKENYAAREARRDAGDSLRKGNQEDRGVKHTLKGVHEPLMKNKGQSLAGAAHKGPLGKEEHKRVLGELQSMKKPNLMAKGGCVGASCPGCSSCYAQGGYIANPSEAQAREGYPVHKDDGGEIDSDDSIMDSVAEELIQAFESKNKSQILDAIRAIVLSCKE